MSFGLNRFLWISSPFTNSPLLNSEEVSRTFLIVISIIFKSSSSKSDKSKNFTLYYSRIKIRLFENNLD
jgi:hypothetical protein